ncbi:MAG: phosphopyruvate hydratase [Patescibacteria group bacterium]|jgi:enolase|nr:phosphopyruvate hydratase [Patescibacteria group bacterium]
MKITKIKAYEILDSRSNPTIETKVFLEDGTVGKASVPSGASTGTKEALELRDGDEKRFSGKGVLKVIDNVENKIFDAIKEIEAENQQEIDQKMIELDGTKNKGNLGANAILSVSLAVARAVSNSQKKPLWKYLRETFELKSGEDFPIPMFNMINGGEHADSGLDLQEYIVVPSGIGIIQEKIRAGSEVYQNLKKILIENNYRAAIGDEGGFAPKLESNSQGLQLINQAIEKAGYKLGEEIFTGLDTAASEFYDKEEKRYNLKLDEASLDSSQLTSMYREWVDKYHMELLEDPMSEFDWEGWTEFTEELGDKITIIGDDLLVTNKEIVEEAIERKACNAVLIKVNQIGSLTEAIECIKFSQGNNMKIAVSHRSGETTDDFISDLAFASQSDYVKFGAPARGERVAKYNRLIEIAEGLKA